MAQAPTTPQLILPRRRVDEAARRRAQLIGAGAGALTGFILDQWVGATLKGQTALLLGGLGAVAGAAAGVGIQEWWQQRRSTDGPRDYIPPARRDVLPTVIKRFTGRTTERQSMDAFFRSDLSGVCLLVGMGGCGKSATIEKFIAEHRWETGSRKDDHPEALLIATFYRNSDVDAFLSWVFDTIAPLFTPQLRQRFERVQGGFNPTDLADILRELDKKVVFVLDGLERIQEEKRSRVQAVGPINNPALRQLLQLAAAGRCGRAKFFLTSRFDIPELGEADGTHFIRHDLNVMRPEDALAILKLKQRVRGADEQLRKICGDYKYHAYSLDLVANALAKHFRRDAREADQIPRMPDEAMSGVLTYYAAKLSEDEAAIMAATSAFREAVSAQLVQGLARTMPNGKPTLTNATFQIVCNELRDTGLLFTEAAAIGEPAQLDLHPIVRDFFKARILNRADVHKAALKLELRPSEIRAESSSEVARISELIYQAAHAGEGDVAWKLYSENLGGYRHLGNNLGNHPKGSQVVETLFEVDAQAQFLSSPQRLRLYVDGALYLKNEGKLDDAVALLRTALASVDTTIASDAEAETGRLSAASESISILDNIAGIQNLRGWTQEAMASADDAYQRVKRSEAALGPGEARRSAKESGSRLATARAMRGDATALALYEELALIPYERSHPPREVLELRYAWLCQRLGMLDRADALLANVDELLVWHANRMVEARAAFYKAQIHLARGDVAQAWLCQEKIDAWAVRVDLEMLVASKLLAGQCYIIEGDLAAARAPLLASVDFSGDNGFGLYWIEAQLWLAGLLFKLGETEDARERVQASLTGNASDFVAPMAGAQDARVAYRWGETDAQALKGAIDRNAALLSDAANARHELGYHSLIAKTFLDPQT